MEVELENKTQIQIFAAPELVPCIKALHENKQLSVAMLSFLFSDSSLFYENRGLVS